jgi:hypothetical protein
MIIVGRENFGVWSSLWRSQSRNQIDEFRDW